jgi:TolA-binding protein
LLLAQESGGQLPAACDVFLTLVASDSSTHAFRDAPLAWFPDAGLDRSAAEALLQSPPSPAAVLIGASHLLATAERSRAERALIGLLNENNPPVAALAEAQLWRAKLMSVTQEEVARWANRIDEMPPAVRAGAYFVLAQARQRLGQNDEAMLAYLRVPILYPSRRALAARALVSAARLGQQAGHTEEAARLLYEVVSEYPDRPERSEAQRLLESWD